MLVFLSPLSYLKFQWQLVILWFLFCAVPFDERSLPERSPGERQRWPFGTPICRYNCLAEGTTKDKLIAPSFKYEWNIGLQ